MAIGLLSTDFDGTLIGHQPDARTTAALVTALTDLRGSGGVWAVNTGRQLWFALEGLEQAHLPHDPEFVLSSEKDIFRRVEEGVGGLRRLECADRAADGGFVRPLERVFDAIREMTAKGDGIEVLYENDRVAGLMTADVATMDRTVEMVRAASADVPEFSFSRNDVWMRFAHRDIHKGSALAELARLLAIPREAVLAIGDHQNDIPMLDGSAAGMVACPANAVDEVKDLVRSCGSYVSPFPWGEGVADAIRHFSA